MNLKGLIHRELGEGMTEEELAPAVKTPVRIVVDILSGRLPKIQQCGKHLRGISALRPTSQKEYSNWQRAAMIPPPAR